ncbi:hypothetical protein [Desulfosporosinus sp. FKB]|uniref:hypothetical protein n=1 Tax=Desulfosporosinus sp. FKB TaxID=1969835 RepID=UPI001481EC2E|nr:hypothetical protein [Desulfosporosinus sp. FKB]
MIKMLWATAKAARFAPLLAAIRWYCDDEYVSFVRDAARADSTRELLNFCLTFLALPDFRF